MNYSKILPLQKKRAHHLKSLTYGCFQPEGQALTLEQVNNYLPYLTSLIWTENDVFYRITKGSKALEVSFDWCEFGNILDFFQ